MAQADRQAIRAFLDRTRDERTALLAELVKVPSDNPPGDCAPHATRAAALLEGLGLSVERHPVPAPAVTPRTTAPVAAAPVAPPPVAPTPAAPTPAATDTARHAGRGSAVAPAAGAAPTTPARPEAMSSSGARPASVRPAPRRVRLTVSRVDPWSAMKVSFLLSVALGIAGVVMVFVLWTILAGMGVFDQINGIVGQVVQDGDQRFDIMDFIGLGRVVSLAIVIGVIDVILITAIATLGAFLYNVSSALVGGIQLTLTDD